MKQQQKITPDQFKAIIKASNLFVAEMEAQAELAQMEEAVDLIKDAKQRQTVKVGIDQLNTMLQVIRDEIQMYEDFVCEGKTVTLH